MKSAPLIDNARIYFIHHNNFYAYIRFPANCLHRKPKAATTFCLIARGQALCFAIGWFSSNLFSSPGMFANPVFMGHRACGSRFYGDSLGRIFSLSIAFHLGQFDSNETNPSDIPINNSIGLRHTYELQNAGPMPITRRKRTCYFIPYFIRIAVSMGIAAISAWYDNFALLFNNIA
jgi:hypothetical protein